MTDVADYDTDILLWSERQAELLRGLKARAPGLPNELDVENLAEEIESVGRTERRAFESYLTQIFIHLMKSASNSDPKLRAKWSEEISNFQIEALKAVTPSMLRRLDVDQVWRYAILKTRIALRRHDETLADVPLTSPFTAELFLVDEPVDVGPLLEEMRERCRVEQAAEN